jgi:hypothetical protein
MVRGEHAVVAGPRAGSLNQGGTPDMFSRFSHLARLVHAALITLVALATVGGADPWFF